MQNTMGMDYKSVEWTRGLKVSGLTGGAATQPCVRFNEIPPAVQERVSGVGFLHRAEAFFVGLLLMSDFFRFSKVIFTAGVFVAFLS